MGAAACVAAGFELEFIAIGVSWISWIGIQVHDALFIPVTMLGVQAAE